MTHLLFATGNAQKFSKGDAICSEYDIHLLQKDLAVDEVQSEDSEYVGQKKAEAAFQAAKVPVLISDDSWAFLGLQGFPGTYAKSVNHWFRPEDFIRLMEGIKDRRVLLTQVLVYQDATQQKLFKQETMGIALEAAQGTKGATIQKVVSLEKDGKTSVSKFLETSSHYSGASTLKVWHDFAKWYVKRKQA